MKPKELKEIMKHPGFCRAVAVYGVNRRQCRRPAVLRCIVSDMAGRETGFWTCAECFCAEYSRQTVDDVRAVKDWRKIMRRSLERSYLKSREGFLLLESATRSLEQEILSIFPCKHCDELGRDHANGKCLFDVTRFKPIYDL